MKELRDINVSNLLNLDDPQPPHINMYRNNFLCSEIRIRFLYNLMKLFFGDALLTNIEIQDLCAQVNVRQILKVSQSTQNEQQ